MPKYRTRTRGTSQQRGKRFQVGGSAARVPGRFKKTNFTGPLTTRERKHLPDADFAIPELRAYPIDTHARAIDALARVDQFGTQLDKERVREAVKKRWPDIKLDASLRFDKGPPGTVQVFRTFDDSSARNAREALDRAGVPYTVTRSKEGSFSMVEFHTDEGHREAAHRIIDRWVNG